jgi:hypothetical protein
MNYTFFALFKVAWAIKNIKKEQRYKLFYENKIFLKIVFKKLFVKSLILRFLLY